MARKALYRRVRRVLVSFTRSTMFDLIKTPHDGVVECTILGSTSLQDAMGREHCMWGDYGFRIVEELDGPPPRDVLVAREAQP